jgi:hypothetical protein
MNANTQDSKPPTPPALASGKGSTQPTQTERTLRYVLRQILLTPHNPGRWEKWACDELEKINATLAE